MRTPNPSNDTRHKFLRSDYDIRKVLLTPFVCTVTLSYKGSFTDYEYRRETRADSQGTAGIPDPQDHFGGQGVCRRHAETAQHHRIRHPGGNSLSAPEQDAPRKSCRLRMARVGNRPTAQILQAHGEGEVAAC